MRAFLKALLAASGSLMCVAAAPPDPVRGAVKAPVKVVVSDLVSTTSTVKLYFYNIRENFLKPGHYTMLKRVQPDGQNKVVIPVELEPGEWAVAITQDVNNNDKLDKNMVGIPTEPYGFSNNFRPRFSAPGFDDCKFIVEGPGKVVTINLVK
ncbi:DUF2141 domain-containing protein [Hymenobacter koreensis]|uniref:DUF2141 domain-containing protein n=1 Tax=Hymenobacter koreensis TaxID=1084523 RepID=A0ABP8IYT5_9BACT